MYQDCSCGRDNAVHVHLKNSSTALVPGLGQPPAPVVDHLEAAKSARERLWALRKDGQAKVQARQIFEKHGSRNPHREGRPKTRKTAKAENTQTNLFDLQG